MIGAQSMIGMNPTFSLGRSGSTMLYATPQKQKGALSAGKCRSLRTPLSVRGPSLARSSQMRPRHWALQLHCSMSRAKLKRWPIKPCKSLKIRKKFYRLVIYKFRMREMAN